MQDLISGAQEVQFALEAIGQPFCFIGGLALLHWGEPRLTVDVDVTLLAGWGREEPIIDAVLGRLPARHEQAKQFALANRILLVRTHGGIPVDIALGALPFEQAATSRSVDVMMAGCPLRLCTPEDLIVMKAFADRPRDWIDIESILKRQGMRLDRSYVLSHLRDLVEAKPDSPILSKLNDLWTRR